MAMLSMKDALKDFVDRSRIKQGLQATNISTEWENIAGKPIAKYTERIQLVKGTLFITTTNASMKNELTYQKTKIIQLVNQFLKEKVVTEVVIK